jgi:integrase
LAAAARGRPPLRIGERGHITRTYLGNGVWRAECRYRDSDGVTRKVRRVGPADENDRKGKLAEDALIGALLERQPSAGTDAIGPDTLVMVLADAHIARLVEEGRAVRTVDGYRYAAEKLSEFLGGVRVAEATAARLDTALRAMNTAHGATMTKHARTVLKGALQLAVLNEVITTNPVRDLSPIKPKTPSQGAEALTAERLRELLATLQASELCHRRDLVDPVTVFMATGLRRAELLGLLWEEFDADAGTLTVTGRVVRARGQGVLRIPGTKTKAGRRTIALPPFAVAALVARRGRPIIGEQSVIFPSSTGTLRDPDNFVGQWRRTRRELGFPDVRSHAFRKTVATLIDEAGYSARIGADHLGHAKISVTQDIYMSRGRVHTQVADLLEHVVRDE